MYFCVAAMNWKGTGRGTAHFEPSTRALPNACASRLCLYVYTVVVEPNAHRDQRLEQLNHFVHRRALLLVMHEARTHRLIECLGHASHSGSLALVVAQLD